MGQQVDVCDRLWGVQDGYPILERFTVGKQRVVGSGIGVARRGDDRDFIDLLQFAQTTRDGLALTDVDHVAEGAAILKETERGLG